MEHDRYRLDRGCSDCSPPQAVSALLRYFRNLDTAEEAFQEACLRAIRTWPDKGPPRDPTAWLIFVGRNSGIDTVRKARRQTKLPPDDLANDGADAEGDLADRLDGQHYRDDILRLLFVCCHPDLPVNQQIALALRIVAGTPLAQIARAFLIGEAAMEQRLTRAKARIAASGVPFEPPDALARSERLSTAPLLLPIARQKRLISACISIGWAPPLPRPLSREINDGGPI